MVIQAARQVLPAEDAPVTHTPASRWEHQGSLVKREPGQYKHESNTLGKNHQKDAEGPQILAGTSTERPKCEMEVSPEPSNSSASPMDQKKPPGKMVMVKSKKRRYASKVWRKLSKKQVDICEEPHVQVGTSIERPQIKMEVSPEPTNSSASPTDQKMPSVKMVKVKSKKGRLASKFWRKLSHKNVDFPKDSEDYQVQAGSSIE
ncbi:hypothetical protein LEMLEM_LOCUS22516, partial [Lemmus lemmus]